MHEEITIVSAETEKPEPTEAPEKACYFFAGKGKEGRKIPRKSLQEHGARYERCAKWV